MAASTRTVQRRVLWSLSAALVLAACSSSQEVSTPTTVLEPRVSSTESPTTTVANRPPQVRTVAVARAEIDERYSDAIVASDPDGDSVVVRVGTGPIGFAPIVNSRGTITGFDWRPTEPGEWDVEVTATDSEGLSSSTTVRLLGRAPRPNPLVLAMGDSIAAGFGRDRSDFLGTDDCFRSESDAYGTLTTRALIDAGALANDAEVLVIGCADATLDLLATDAVYATTGSGDRLDQQRTQLAWASSLNPTIITLTIGGATGGYFDLESQFIPAATDGRVELDEVALTARHQALQLDLERYLNELLITTDARIAITTYYDPTAADPVGVTGCEGSCFREAMAWTVGGLNDAIVGAAEAASMERISIVRLDGIGDVWEASNGLGPDFVRDGLGPLQRLVDRFTGGSSATCADDGDPPEDLVSALDCLHPNTAGHRVIANRVTDVLLSI